MLKSYIETRAREMGICLPHSAAEQICAYHLMLVEAGKKMNLTRVSEDIKEAADRNYLDSLSLLAHPSLVENVFSLADVGAGAGLPGVLLSIALPRVQVTLIDSLAKRIAFLQEVIKELGLNARAIHARCEDAGRDPALRDGFDLAVSRAVADTPLLLELALPLVRPGGKLVAYKGPLADEEARRSARALEQLAGRVEDILPAPIPGRDWEHKLLVVEKLSPTPDRYPRKAGMPAKKPLI